MSAKTRKILMTLVGLYLMYTGSRIVWDVIKIEPVNRTALITVGAVCALIGLASAGINLWALVKKDNPDSEMSKGAGDASDEILLDEDAEPIDDDTEEGRREEKRGSGVQIVKVGEDASVKAGKESVEEKKPTEKEKSEEAKKPAAEEKSAEKKKPEAKEKSAEEKKSEEKEKDSNEKEPAKETGPKKNNGKVIELFDVSK